MNQALQHINPDASGRIFKKLRISLTSRCNMACGYCVSQAQQARQESNVVGLPHSIVSSVAAIIYHTPIKAVRLTGGEPLLYPHCEELTLALSQLGIADISMTTNGLLLAAKAPALYRAGMRSVNVSLDAVDEKVFAQITPYGTLHKVTAGIEAAIKAGMTVKLNAVIQKGVNESQIVPLFEWAAARNIDIRYLEIMRMGHLHAENITEHLIDKNEILDTLSKVCRLSPTTRSEGATSLYWHSDKGIRIGIIANESEPFCSDCDRLRMDASGRLYGCISAQTGLRPDYSSSHSIKMTLTEVLKQKQPAKFVGSPVAMIKVGG